jgi:putative MATE family efflux protein
MEKNTSLKEKLNMDLLKDNIPKLVRKLALPAMVGMLFQTLYNIVDTFYAGKISPEALSALSKSFPIYFIIVASSIGVTVAGTSLIGNSIGENNKKNILNYFTHIIYFAIIMSVIICFVGLSFSDKIFSLMVTTDEVINLGTQYTDIIFSGSILFILIVALNSLLHAEGDTKTYRNVLILSFFINLILNPVLIFGLFFFPALGFKGIAISTIISQLVAFFIILSKVLKNSRIKEITKENLVPKIFYFINIFFTAMPIVVSIFAYSITATIVLKYVGISGEYAVAGYGAGTRIEQVVLLPILGINTAIISIIAQNFGAKNFERVKETYFTSIKYSFLIMIISGTILYISSDLIMSFFSNDQIVIEFGSRYLKICSFILPAYPIFFLSNGMFMAIKKAEYAMISNLFRNGFNPLVVFFLASYINASFEIFFWIWAVVNWIFSGIYLSILIFYIKAKLEKTSAIVNPQP